MRKCEHPNIKRDVPTEYVAILRMTCPDCGYVAFYKLTLLGALPPGSAYTRTAADA